MGSKQKKKAGPAKNDLFEKPMENPFQGIEPRQKVPVKTEEPFDPGKLMENPFTLSHEEEKERLVPMRIADRRLTVPEKEPEVVKKGRTLRMPQKPPRDEVEKEWGKGLVVKRTA